ncbi:MAG: HU family DNA-binding protein [Anaerolineae bacterium]
MAKKRMSKSQFVEKLAEKCDITRKQAASALAMINIIIFQELAKGGPGEVVIPSLLRLSVAEKPAAPEHEGINPFTKEPMTYKARPARKVIRVRLLKALKDAV